MKRKICFVAPLSYGYFTSNKDEAGGGAERQTYMLAKELSDNYDVHVIVGDFGQRSHEVIEGVHLHRSYIPCSNAGLSGRISQLLGLFRSIKNTDADVYLFRSNPLLYILGRGIVAYTNSKCIYHISNDKYIDIRDSGFLIQALYSLSLCTTNEVIAQTAHQKDLLKEKYELEAVLISNGYYRVDSILSHSQRDHHLWVGTLDGDQKRADILLDIVKESPDSKFCVINGVNPTTRSGKILESKIKHQENVVYRKSVNPQKIHKYYKNAISCINTSDYEGFPNILLESWRYGTPVLTYTIDLGRYMEKSYSELSNISSVEDFSKTIKYLEEDEEYWTKVSELVKEQFEDNYSIEKIASRYDNVIDSCLNDES